MISSEKILILTIFNVEYGNFQVKMSLILNEIVCKLNYYSFEIKIKKSLIDFNLE